MNNIKFVFVFVFLFITLFLTYLSYSQDPYPIASNNYNEKKYSEAIKNYSLVIKNDSGLVRRIHSFYFRGLSYYYLSEIIDKTDDNPDEIKNDYILPAINDMNTVLDICYFPEANYWRGFLTQEYLYKNENNQDKKYNYYYDICSDFKIACDDGILDKAQFLSICDTTYITAIKYYRLAGQYFQDEKFIKAIEAYKKITEIYPNEPDPYFELASIYYNIRKFDEAIKYQTRYNELKPKDPYGYGNLGYFYLQTYEYYKAIKEFENCLVIDTNSWDANIGLSLAYYRLYNKDKAYNYISKAISKETLLKNGKQGLTELKKNGWDISYSSEITLLNILDEYELFNSSIEYKNELSISMLLSDVEFNVNKDIDGCSYLYLASVSGDLELCKYLIEKGADINKPDKSGMTPLACAAFWNQNKIVELLLSKGAKVNTTKSDGSTPLMQAAESNNLEALKLLIEMGANVNSVESRNKTALMIAVQYGNLGIVKFLVEKGANINNRDYLSLSSLDFAICKYRNDIARYLIENGANLLDTNALGDNAFLFSVEYENVDVIRFLAARTKNIKEISNTIYSKLTTPRLFVSRKFDNYDTLDVGNIYSGHFSEILNTLLNFGFNPNAGEQDLGTPLMKSITLEDIELTENLIKHGADVNVRVNTLTPLHIAINEHNQYLVKLLIAKGADITAKTHNGISPLMLSIVENDFEVFKLLISKGAEVNAKSNDGTTPLMLAVNVSNSKMVDYLITLGAKVNEKDNSGNTFIDYALTPSMDSYLFNKGYLNK